MDAANTNNHLTLHVMRLDLFLPNSSKIIVASSFLLMFHSQKSMQIRNIASIMYFTKTISEYSKFDKSKQTPIFDSTKNCSEQQHFKSWHKLWS